MKNTNIKTTIEEQANKSRLSVEELDTVAGGALNETGPLKETGPLEKKGTFGVRV